MSLGKADHRESAVSIISAEGDILSTRLIIVDVSLDHLTKVVFFITQFLFFFFFLCQWQRKQQHPNFQFQQSSSSRSKVCTDGVGRVIAPSSVGW